MARLQRLHAAAEYLARNAPEIIANPEASRGLEQQLIHAMVESLGPAGSEEDRSAKRSHSRIMRRFHAAVAATGDRAVYLSELCSVVGVSDRTLRACCQEQLGMSPLRYLWLRRMQLARRALVRAEPTSTTVTDVATGHGFWELGRFAVAYAPFMASRPL
jgi:AraC-like DNA-binding protein